MKKVKLGVLQDGNTDCPKGELFKLETEGDMDYFMSAVKEAVEVIKDDPYTIKIKVIERTEKWFKNVPEL